MSDASPQTQRPPAGSSHELESVQCQDESESLLVPNGSETRVHKPAGAMALNSLELEQEQQAQLNVQLATRNNLSLFRKPAPWWYLVGVFCVACAAASSVAPTIDLLTRVICDDYKRRTIRPYDIVCSSDPQVQSGVASLMAGQAAILGILSCVTTAWWASLSDRTGRTWIAGICGFPVLDICFILVGLFPTHMPGGYKFMLVGSAFQGILGADSSILAIMQAYLTDCSAPGDRARLFSLFLGFAYAGMSLGPTISSLLIDRTGSIMSAFYFALVVDSCVPLFSLFVIPESLLPIHKKIAQEKHDAELQLDNPGSPLRVAFRRLFGFLTPLSVLLPVRREDGRRDWNLTLVALAAGSFGIIGYIQPFLLQYAQATLAFSTQMMGYAVSIAGGTKAIYLTIMLPLLIKFLKSRYKSPIELPSPDSSEAEESDKEDERHAPAIDLTLARFSAITEITVYLFFPLATNTWTFIGALSLTSFGAGFLPAAQAIALELFRQRDGSGAEAGRLFGALSIVRTVSQYVVGPLLFAEKPAALFLIALGATGLAFVLVWCVRLPGLGEARRDDVEASAQT